MIAVTGVLLVLVLLAIIGVVWCIRSEDKKRERVNHLRKVRRAKEGSRNFFGE